MLAQDHAITSPEARARLFLPSLPPDLLHYIFTCIHLADIIAIRQTCSILAGIGLDHLLDQVALAYHRKSFEALLDITKHPTLSKRVEALNFQADRLRFLPRQQWERHRLDLAPPADLAAEFPTIDVEHGFTERAACHLARAGRRYKQSIQQRKDSVPP